MDAHPPLQVARIIAHTQLAQSGRLQRLSLCTDHALSTGRHQVRLPQAANPSQHHHQRRPIDDTIARQRPTTLAPATAKMLSCRIVRAAPTAAATAARRLPLVQQRTFLPDWNKDIEKKYPASDYPSFTEAEDPGMNGQYIQPAPVKRQFRDPYGDWWDKQERKNFGEALHEDDDTLGMFTTYEYTWISPGKGLVQIGIFVAVFLSVLYAVKATYPDRPAYPREFEGGLERELGGRNAVRARAIGDPEPFQDEVDVD